MKIQEITSQHRRDFTAILECEHCGHTIDEHRGYDDTSYHQNVIPKIRCPKCGEAAPEDHRPLAPKYGADVTL